MKNGQTPSYPRDNLDTWLSQLTKGSSPMKKPGPDTSEERLLDSSIDFLTLFILSSSFKTRLFTHLLTTLKKVHIFKAF